MIPFVCHQKKDSTERWVILIFILLLNSDVIRWPFVIVLFSLQKKRFVRNDLYFYQEPWPLGMRRVTTLVGSFFFFGQSQILRILWILIVQDAAELTVSSSESFVLFRIFWRKICRMLGSSLRSFSISRSFWDNPFTRAFADVVGLSFLIGVEGQVATSFFFSNVWRLWRVNFLVLVLQKYSTFSLQHNFVLYSFHHLIL